MAARILFRLDDRWFTDADAEAVEAFGRLSDDERYMVATDGPWSLKHRSRELRTTRKRAGQIQSRAMAKLRTMLFAGPIPKPAEPEGGE